MESIRSTEGRGRARRPVARLVALGMAAALAVCLLPGTVLAAGPATHYIVTSSDYSPYAGNGVTITAQLADTGGLSVGTSGLVVTWTKTGAGGTFATATSTTNAAGVATVVFTTDSAAYPTTYHVIATDGQTTPMTGTSTAITTVAPALTINAPNGTTVVEGHTLTFTAYEGTTNVTGGSTGWTTNDPYLPAVPCTNGTVSGVNTETCSFFTVGTVIVQAIADPLHFATITVNVVSDPAQAVTQLDIKSIQYAPSATPAVNPPFAETLGVADIFVVKALDQYNNVQPAFTDFVRITSNDPLFTQPADAKLTSGVGNFSATFGTTGPFTVIAFDVATPTILGSTTVLVSVVNVGSRYHVVTPVRLLDTRVGNGITGALTANTPATFTVAGRGGVPIGAVAVTGNLTVTGSTAGWAVYLGPSPVASPTSSSINFTAGQVRANSLTVGLSATGTLSATYISTAGNKTDLVFDVTGYYGPVGGGGAGYYQPTGAPTRVLDTRNNTGFAGKISAGLPATFYVNANSPCGGGDNSLIAVTGNITVVNATAGWALFLGPYAQALPTSSTVNFVAGQIVANGVTVGVSSIGTLSATYISLPGNTTDLVFDVTGYYCTVGGANFVPVAPTRLLDTRVGNGYSFPLFANLPQSFQVSGRGGIPAYAVAVTGNVTVVNETNGWSLYVGAVPEAIAPTSNINFLKGDIVANGMTSAIHLTNPWPAGELGQLSATYISTGGNTTDLVFDVSGYFE